MEKKTYGVDNYMDWVAQIPVGRSSVKVHFTGGALTSYGVTPAEYTTDNPFFQNVIEGSQYYKDGRIKLLRSLHISDPEPKKPAPQPAAAPAVEAEAAAGEQPKDAEEIEVSCLQDAREVLAERFSVPTWKIKSWANANAIAQENGIVFVEKQ